MKRFFVTIIYILLFIHSIPLISQAMNIDEAWIKMEENNPTLLSLLIDEEAALREIKSREYLIPSIGISSNISRTSPLISGLTNSDNIGAEADNWSLRGGIDLRLNLNKTVKLEDRIKSIEYNILLLEKQIKIRDLRGSLKRLYYQISAGEQSIKLQERILGLSQSRYKQIEDLYNKGLRSEFELLSSQISVARDKPALKKAQIDQDKRLIQFRQLIGVEPELKITLVFPEDYYNSINLEPNNINLSRNEELKISLLQLEKTKINKEIIIKNQRTPSLGFNLGWSTGFNPLFNKETWSSEDWRDSLGLGVSFALPLDPFLRGSKGELERLKIDDNIKKLEINLEDSKRKLFDNVLSLLLDLDLSNSNIEVNKLNIKLQENNFVKVQKNYENGRTSLQDLDSTRQELQKVLISLENEKLNRNLIFIELEKILGTTF
ncbi:TolC family protein [Thiospirochaeta perfilievii]|uniref:TolC family protein n=1 Tax=Thiospirochaeta perfilievii TaxID=252967 RepID=A0A5C1Q633_9SPIO|nr:TolC family protein [Thiospirochaeta perfilievii]QEN03523.1 TolC family protein [Thiospirochaeta perfilievii]